MPPDYQLPLNNGRADLQYTYFGVPVVPSHATLRASYHPSIFDHVTGTYAECVHTSEQYVAYDHYGDLYTSTSQPIPTEEYAHDFGAPNVPCPIDCVKPNRCMEEGGETNVSYGPDPSFSDYQTCEPE